MNTQLSTKLTSFFFAALLTVTLLGSLDALATSGQSADALLSQQGHLQMACSNGLSKS